MKEHVTYRGKWTSKQKQKYNKENAKEHIKHKEKHKWAEQVNRNTIKWNRHTIKHEKNKTTPRNIR